MVLFLLSWIPDSVLLTVFYAITAIGLALVCISWFITIIPFINRYRFPIQVIGVAALTVGAYMTGGYGVQMMWKQRVEEVQAKLAAAEAKSQEVVTVIQEKIVYKTKVVHDVQTKIQEKIIRDAAIIDAECKVPRVAIDDINQSAETPAGDKAATKEVK
jgi:hypothetical protein